SGNIVELEAFQAWQETPRQRDGIEAIKGKRECKQSGFMSEHAKIKAQIMPDQNGPFDKLQKFRKDCLRDRRFSHHLWSNAGKLDDKIGEVALGIKQRLKSAFYFSTPHPYGGNLYDAIGCSHTSCFGINHHKINIIKGLLCTLPGFQRPENGPI